MIVETNLFDHEETHHNCLVQILTNSITGEQSPAERYDYDRLADYIRPKEKT